jgi:GNS1/SUR4 family
MSVILFWIKQLVLFTLYGGDKFEWVRGKTPMSSLAWPLGGMLVYLAVLAGLRVFIVRPLRIPTAFMAVHNLILCVGSAIMFVGCLSSVVTVRYTPSLFLSGLVHQVSHQIRTSCRTSTTTCRVSDGIESNCRISVIPSHLLRSMQTRSDNAVASTQQAQ